MTEQRPDLIDPARTASRDGVLRAADKIAAILPCTPLLPIEVNGVTVWAKAEGLQPVGAFKIRGGWHRLSDLTEAQRAGGVVAFSSGNHAQGVAWAARRLGVPALILMPHDAPLAKIEGTRALGAEIRLFDRLRDSREALGAALAAERGAVLVPSFDDPWVIEGQGSLAIEAEAQLRALTGRAPARFVCGCGGGGMASGIALACPDAAVVIAEPEGWDDMRASIAGGAILPVAADAPPTLCDALQTPRVAERTFAVLRHRATALAVSEAEVRAAVRLAFRALHLVVEPGGAAGLAALLAGKAEPREDTVVVLSGGNVDPATYAAILSETEGDAAA